MQANSKIYKYPVGIKYGKMIAVFGVVLGMILIILIVIALFVSSDPPPNKFGILFLGLFILISILFYCSFPDIRVSDEILQVECFGFSLKLNWNEIVAIKPIEQHFARLMPRLWFVQISRRSPIHLCYGLWYQAKVQPGFLIRGNIENANELIEELKIRVKKRY